MPARPENVAFTQPVDTQIHLCTPLHALATRHNLALQPTHDDFDEILSCTLGFRVGGKMFNYTLMSYPRQPGTPIVRLLAWQPVSPKDIARLLWFLHVDGAAIDGEKDRQGRPVGPLSEVRAAFADVKGIPAPAAERYRLDAGRQPAHK